MANDNLSAGDRWVRTIMEEIRRFKSLMPRPGRKFRFTSMPPEVRVRVNKSLGIWPVPQSKRDEYVSLVAKKMFGLLGSFVLRHGVIPEPETSRAAAAAEAEGFAAASAYAAGKSLATDEERSDVFRTYVKEMCLSAYRYAKSRPQAAGTSRSGSAAQPPPAASVAVVSGPVQLRGCRRCLRRRLPLPPQE